ncbi:HYC_CC_PP family protein [Hydrotalea flava]
MKKLGAIFLLIVYTSTALGVSINFHYCSGHLTHVSIINFGGKTGCSCNPEAMPKGCCKDKLVVSKADNHNSTQAYFIANIISFVPHLPPVNCLQNLILNSGGFNANNSWTKYVKRSCTDPIYLLIRVFRI